MALLADASQRLVVALDREDAEAAGDAGLELDVLDPAGALVADVVVVRGLAADDRADARDALVAAGLGADLGRHRQLEAARHLDHVDLVSGVLEDGARALDQLLRKLLVEGGRGDRVPVRHAGRAPLLSDGHAASPRGSSPRRGRDPGGEAGGP